MKKINSTDKAPERKPAKLPLLQVRTHLRGGESLEDCQRNLKYWQNEYNDYYEKAQKKFDL
jgi:hypothetical protein